jgi:hypothetical protein
VADKVQLKNVGMSAQKHIWNFVTVGGVKRVHLESGEDLKHLHELDQKLWTALSCPVDGLEIDERTLSLMDADGDGQIRVPEVLQAVNWMMHVLKNPDDLLLESDTLALDAINTTNEEGKHLFASAQTILRNLGKADSTAISANDTQDIHHIFTASKLNGDGVITPESTNNIELVTCIQEIMQCLGTVKDRSEQNGIDLTLLQTFKDACLAYYSWHQKSKHESASILPMGDVTPQAYETYVAVKSKIDDYFLRCQLAAFDTQTTAVLNLANERVANISEKNLVECMDEIASYPLSRIEAQGILPLTQGINPAWVTAMQLFKQQVSDVILNAANQLTQAQWQTIKSYFEAYENWLAEKPITPIEALGLERIAALATSPTLQQVEQVIEADLALAQEANNIILVDKLMRYHRDLFTLLKNFVTFYDFYTPGKKAIFQAGTLYIDQRSCDLCIKVNNMEKHQQMASLSGMFLLYCECTAKHSNEKMLIAAALTNGDIDNLMEGRNAVFYDRDGNDWDARVVKIMDNPISIRQAFWSPYRKVSRFIETQINKFAAAQDDKVTSDAKQKIEELPAKATQEPKAPAQPFDVGKFVGIFAAISLALGAIGTAIASFISGFIALTWWKMPLAVAGILLLISGPSMIMAYLKLRKRNLAPLLDANGWAINAGAVINIQFGNLLTHLADLPSGAKINLNDPFTKKQRPMLPYILLLSLLIGMLLYFLWKMGAIKIHF